MSLHSETPAEAQVWSRLRDVSDPELDESIVDLGFVDSVEIVHEQVTVRFRLPTYWCSPNFAFMMAFDIKERIATLGWVTGVLVELLDHCTSDDINEGIARQRSFEDVFKEEATGDLVALRLVFRRKAFMARQERLIKQLLADGRSAADLVTMSLRDLQVGGSPDDGLSRQRYLAIRDELGMTDDGEAAAFTTADGRPLTCAGFDDYLRSLRSCRMNMEINTHLCRGLLLSRYGPTGAPGERGMLTTATEAPLKWLTGRSE